MKRILVLIFVSLLAFAPAAYGQATWPTPQTPSGGPTVTGGVGMCLNATGQAIPCNATTPAYSLSEILVGSTPTAVSSSNPMPISGSFSATLAGFAPGASWAQLSVSSTSSRVLLPSGTVVIVYNTGANAAYVAIGNSGIVATTGEDYIPSGGALALTVGANTYIAGITSSSTTTLNISGGTGLPTGWGAGGGGGSVPTGSAGSPNAAVVTVQGITGGTPEAVSWTGQTVGVTSLPTLPTGANTIGAVTQASGPWTTNLTQISGASISTSSSGTQMVGIVGHAGAAFDAIGQNGSSPANEIIIGGQFNTTPTTITSGNVSPLQLDSAGNLLVDVKAGAAGTSSSFGATFPSLGTAAGLEYLVSAPTLVAGTMGAFQGDVSGNLKVNLQTALPAGTNTVGNVGVNNKPVGPATIATSQTASVTTSATSIVAARTGAVGTGRASATIYNNGTVTVYIGTSGVTTSTGIPLIAGAALTLDTTAAIYGIVSSTAGSVSAVETF